jgi:hypothetical protein
MAKQFYKDAFGWGLALWFIGYVFGIILFPFVPAAALGWIISPFCIIITLLVLFKKIKGDTFGYYVRLGIIWALIAVIFDYLFIVKAFKSVEYYKLDIYLYYVLMLVLPLLAGWRKKVI